MNEQRQVKPNGDSPHFTRPIPSHKTNMKPKHFAASLLTTSLFMLPVLPANAAKQRVIQEGPFQLLEGQGVPVCEAYRQLMDDRPVKLLTGPAEWFSGRAQEFDSTTDAPPKSKYGISGLQWGNYIVAPSSNPKTVDTSYIRHIKLVYQIEGVTDEKGMDDSALVAHYKKFPSDGILYIAAQSIDYDGDGKTERMVRYHSQTVSPSDMVGWRYGAAHLFINEDWTVDYPTTHRLFPSTIPPKKWLNDYIKHLQFMQRHGKRQEGIDRNKYIIYGRYGIVDGIDRWTFRFDEAYYQDAFHIQDAKKGIQIVKLTPGGPTPVCTLNHPDLSRICFQCKP